MPYSVPHSYTKLLSVSRKWIGQPIPEIYSLEIFGFDRTGNSAIQTEDPKTPRHPHEVDRMTRCADIDI